MEKNRILIDLLRSIKNIEHLNFLFSNSILFVLLDDQWIFIRKWFEIEEWYLSNTFAGLQQQRVRH